MGIFDGCLLGLDVDGTLILGDYLPPRNIAALDYFRKEGGTICLATGRTAPALAPIIEKYNHFGPSVVGNGSMIYDIENDEVLYEKCLSDEAKRGTVEILEKCPTVGCELHCREHVVVISRTKETDDHEIYEKIPTVFSDKQEIFNLKLQKALLLFTPGPDEDTVKEFLKDKDYGCDFVPSACTIDGVGRRYLEQLPRGISKAQTVLRFCKMRGIEKQRLFAIGDYFNDIEMLNASGISACPASSPDEVKAVADYTVCAPKDGAVGDFIDILKRRIKNGQ